MEAPTIHDLVKQEKSEDAGFVRWPDADRLLAFIEMRGFPAPTNQVGWTCIRCNSEVDMTLLRCKCNNQF